LDTQPLRLLIVSPQRDLEVLKSGLPAFPNIEASVRGEPEFFPRFSRFYMLPAWYRQQIIKLEIPALLRFGGYLTLDSDACCVGDFDATTFIKSGRALSGWEPKRHHEWWQHAAEFVGIPYDPAAHGLSVTPNVLHSDLARQTLEFVGLGGIDSQTALGFRLLRKIGQVAWTEYSLYTRLAEQSARRQSYRIFSVEDGQHQQLRVVMASRAAIGRSKELLAKPVYKSRIPIVEISPSRRSLVNPMTDGS
jgi:hypothetical protein